MIIDNYIKHYVNGYRTNLLLLRLKVTQRYIDTLP